MLTGLHLISVQFGPQPEKDLHLAIPTEIHISDKMEATILTKCLELTKLLKDQKTSFDIKIKLESSNIRMTSEENKGIKLCKKSPSQLKRDEVRMKKFVDSKSQTKAPTTSLMSGEPKSGPVVEKPEFKASSWRLC